MFDRISPRYDFLNRLLAWGLDISWRKRLGRYLPERQGLQLLDLATGTADVPLLLVRHFPNIDNVNGVDMARKMLDIGRAKVDRASLVHKIQLSPGDASQIPFPDSQFDAATMAFGIRNVADPMVVFREMQRVLKPQGRALILEFSLPENAFLRWGHLIYLRTVVPVIGWLVSGHYKAYKYLNSTIETFPHGEKFCRMMREAGFKNVLAHPLFAGVATIYQGDKA